MAEATSSYVLYNSRRILNAYSRKVKEAKTYFNLLSNEGRSLVNNYENNEQNIETFINSAIYDINFFASYTDKQLIELADYCFTINKNLQLGIQFPNKITKINNKEKNLVFERIEELKTHINTKDISNKSETEILFILNSFSDEELYIVQKDLYELQKAIYKKLLFDQDKAAREFYNTRRKGLFVTKDETGKIIKLNYTPGNDVVFVNRKGELLEYFKYEGGSKSEFFGNVLGIGKNRADWMMMVAGYDYSFAKEMNIATTNTNRSTFSEFNIFGNELKPEISPEHKNDKIKCEVLKKYPEIYARFGDRISGINGTIIELDDGKGKVLGGVPYFHQCDNDTVDGPQGDDNRVYGSVMCQLTSLAMILASKGVKTKDSTKQLEDVLYEISKDEDFGYGKSKTLWSDPQTLYTKIIPKLKEKQEIETNGVEFDSEKGSFSEDEDFSNIISQINLGNPVIVDLKFNVDDGHVVVCIGYTENSLIIHDPYGNLEHGSNNGYGGANRDYNGAFVEYPKTKYKLGKNWIRYLEEDNNEEENN